MISTWLNHLPAEWNDIAPVSAPSEMVFILSLQTKWFANWLRSGSFDSQDCWWALELPKDWMSLNGLNISTYEYRCLSIERHWFFISGLAWRTCVMKAHVLPFIHLQSLEKVVEPSMTKRSFDACHWEAIHCLSEEAVFRMESWPILCDICLWLLAFIDMDSSWSCASLG